MALTTTQSRDSADATMSTAIRSESDQPTTMRPFKPITVKGHSTPSPVHKYAMSSTNS